MSLSESSSESAWPESTGVSFLGHDNSRARALQLDIEANSVRAHRHAVQLCRIHEAFNGPAAVSDAAEFCAAEAHTAAQTDFRINRRYFYERWCANGR